jgi:hypothetical protein
MVVHNLRLGFLKGWCWGVRIATKLQKGIFKTIKTYKFNLIFWNSIPNLDHKRSADKCSANNN